MQWSSSAGSTPCSACRRRADKAVEDHRNARRPRRQHRAADRRLFAPAQRGQNATPAPRLCRSSPCAIT
jgi:hypothetical protein